MQQLIAKEIEAAEEGHVSYEIQWIIPNWREVRRDVSLVNSQKATFETGLQSSKQVIQTKWLVGLKDVPFEQDDSTRARIYWQLVGIKGPGSGTETKLKVKIGSVLGYPDEGIERGRLCRTAGNLNLYETIEENNEYLDVGADVEDSVDNYFISSSDSVQYTLILSFKPPVQGSSQFKRQKLEQFSKQSHSQLRETLAKLLNEDADADLKIITSDGVELAAHQIILKAQCPVFAGMLNSNLSESKTGIVKVEDISGKTMKILLHYFYTGDLLDGWSDQDTILEFTYAAGKYQVIQVLKLIDDLFGTSDEDEVSNLDVQLLSLSGKLSLKNAEEKLLQRVVGKITTGNSAEELFQLFGYDKEEIIRRAEILADEHVRESKVLDILEYALGDVSQQNEDFSQRGLIVLALVQRNDSLKILEKTLLKRFAEIASQFTKAEELFALFGDCK